MSELPCVLNAPAHRRRITGPEMFRFVRREMCVTLKSNMKLPIIEGIIGDGFW